VQQCGGREPPAGDRERADGFPFEPFEPAVIEGGLESRGDGPVVDRRAENDTVRGPDALPELGGVTGVAVVTVVHRQVELAQIEQFRLRACVFCGRERVCQCDPCRTPVP
jgi:NADH:ubiquinone oxidoreductase subunit F (NADH-binding)